MSDEEHPDAIGRVITVGDLTDRPLSEGPSYGSPGRSGSVVARELVDKLELSPTDVRTCLEVAGVGRRPALRTLEDLDGAEPAVFYYFARLAQALAAERSTMPSTPAPSTFSETPLTTNRPTYVDERRPGDPNGHFAGTYLETSARELLIFAIDAGDAATLAAIWEAGAAAIKYAPAHGITDGLTRQADYRLGVRAARALRAEAARLDAREKARHAETERRQRAEDRAAKAAAKEAREK